MTDHPCCSQHSAWCSVSDHDGPPFPCCWDCPGSYNQARIRKGAHRPTGTGWPR